MKIKNMLIISISLLLASCMPSRAMMHGGMGMKKIETIGNETSERILDELIESAVRNIPGIDHENSIAVLDLTVDVPDLNPGVVRQKLITTLVNRKDFSVVTREHMTDLLEEMGLYQSGVVSDSILVQSGRLIGIDRFISGRLYRKGDDLTLILQTIESRSGIISWSRSFTRNLWKTAG